jgi:hypothetical protein
MFNYVDKNKIEMSPIEALEVATQLMKMAQSVLASQNVPLVRQFKMPLIDVIDSKETEYYPSRFLFVVSKENNA